MKNGVVRLGFISDFDQFIIDYRDIVEKPSSHGGGCDVLDM